MQKRKSVGLNGSIDPDEAPELTDDYFERADVYDGEVLISRGRPRLAQPKRQVTLRLSPDVLDHFKASGRGWQTRIDETLKRAIAAK